MISLLRITVCYWTALVALAPTCEPSTPLLGVPWPATDRLDRSLPLTDDAGPPRSNRFVGLFYFLWHNKAGRQGAMGEGPSDISKILTTDPDAIQKPNSLLWGPLGTAHYWGEPLYGYYRSDDRWVLRRHAYVLADAGIDVLIFDATNAESYPDIYMKLCEVFRAVRQEGGQTPQIAFMVNTRAGETADEIYRALYQPQLYHELWFCWQGKPLMICDPDKASAEVREFFTLRRAHWPFTMVNTDRAWHWEAAYPQPYGYVGNSEAPEQVNVSVAQNLRKSDGQVTNMSDGDARGRSFHRGHTESAPNAVDHGYNFEEQWRRALELDPTFVMITGWNEWIAGRFERPGKPVVFVDQYDQEHSRDIEFARHGHLDNYYYQMVSGIRRFKGVPNLPKAGPVKRIDIMKGFEQWLDVVPEYRDHVGEAIPRGHSGIGGTHYHNTSGRNDVVACKVTRDAQWVYFYLRTASALQTSSAPQDLWLFIDSDRQRRTGWEGYDFIVGRTIDDEGLCWLEKNVTGWSWERVAAVKFRQAGAELHLAVPAAQLAGIENGPLNFDFKWADKLQRPGDVQDFYLSGDVAPEGRFNYRFVEN